MICFLIFEISCSDYFACNTIQLVLYSGSQKASSYRENERDVAFIRVDVRGLKNGRRIRKIHELFDYRILATGLMAMNRTVGYTASIGAKMIVRGDITKRGVLSPARDVNYRIFRDELKKRGMRIRRKEFSRQGI